MTARIIDGKAAAATLRAHVAETRTMINEWESKRERSARYGRELIPLAQQRTSALLSAYRGGKASLPDVLAAQGDTIRVLHTLTPIIVAMAGANEFDPYKD